MKKFLKIAACISVSITALEAKEYNTIQKPWGEPAHVGGPTWGEPAHVGGPTPVINNPKNTDFEKTCIGDDSNFITNLKEPLRTKCLAASVNYPLFGNSGTPFCSVTTDSSRNNAKNITVQEVEELNPDVLSGKSDARNVNEEKGTAQDILKAACFESGY